MGLREPGGDLEGARAPGTAPRRPPPPPPHPPGRAPGRADPLRVRCPRLPHCSDCLFAFCYLHSHCVVCL